MLEILLITIIIIIIEFLARIYNTSVHNVLLFQSAFTCSDLTIEALELGVEYVQS